MSVAPLPVPDDAAEPPHGMSLGRALLRTARPKQWLKNVLVFAAPAAAGVLDDPAQLGRTMVAFVSFCIASSGTYFLNDALDHEADRQHPTKRTRPIAAGALSPGAAKVLAVVLVLVAMLIAAPINDGLLSLTVLGYVAL